LSRRAIASDFFVDLLECETCLLSTHTCTHQILPRKKIEPLPYELLDILYCSGTASAMPI
jgi:hypothetical protein